MLALALLMLGGGAFVAYAGVTGQPIAPALRDVLSGRKPAGSVGAAADVQRSTGVEYDTTGGVAARVAQLIAAAPGGITVTSGTRTRAQQTKLWNDALAKYGSPEAARKWVAPPGSSMHERGLANDLAFASAAVREWAHANAYRFGLVFPLSNEPWHVEVAGARGGAQLVGGEPVRTQPVRSEP